jgi:hypothetical protein
MPAPIRWRPGEVKLKAGSFNLLNRGNRRVQITVYGFMSNAPESYG